MHELFSPDSEFHIEKKNKLSEHLMILSVYISLGFAEKIEEEAKELCFCWTCTRIIPLTLIPASSLLSQVNYFLAIKWLLLWYSLKALR